MLGPQAQLLCVGVTTRQFWLKANAKIGIDFELNPSAAAAGAPSPFDSGALRVNLTALTVTVRAEQAAAAAHHRRGPDTAGRRADRQVGLFTPYEGLFCP